ncbi:FAD-dependent oxidoreductase [Arthrobacter sp. CAU 1506]|uniref:NAD(P)/FAD-dependent oxidoreductase n=1 Tax=Arthrobacter sp. CAU 1506 TaxID=2560052 RepID=UPI0010AD263A|nr:FAD-dependent oxidoreductase [Arthrobacter sp. CAU 1506]TJY69921.1 FAD-dependent oxidoreductase [Arthrobacter sp. CAU 1506]
MVNGEVSFWYADGGLPEPGPALTEDTTADVAVVGAGYTGLWTAYYLKQARPELDVVVLESRFAGFGASGRNGGWLTNSMTGGREDYAASHGRELTGRFQTLLNETVDEVIRVAAAEGIDADIAKGGELIVARNPAQQQRLQDWAAAESVWPEAGARLLDAAETSQRIRIDRAVGSLFQPHCARIQPAKLVRGLADTVRRMGVRLYEGTTVTEILPNQARTDRGTVEARYILRATEGFTAGLKSAHRDWLPMNSSLIVTEPLPEHVWTQIGWDGAEALGDMAHAYMYAQRTSDGRIALGGRGVPYRYGSGLDTDGATQPKTVAQLADILHSMFPATRSARLEHAWSGVLGVPRDWKATVGLDPQTGLGWAGGYVGTGVAATNLAARTLRDLIVDPGSELTRMPWVNRKVRRWEVEPLRWLAVKAMYSAYHAADRAENGRLKSTSLIARMADKVSGRS